MNYKSLAASLATLIGLALAPAAQAGVIYSEGFTAGQYSPWTQGDSYWSNCATYQNCVQPSGGQSGAYFDLHTGGSTAAGWQPDHRFFISPEFAVNQNADYTLTFYVRDYWFQNSGGPQYTVPIMAQINGTQVGGLVKAINGGWNEIDIAWNSGLATTAIITLLDEYQLSTWWANQGGSTSSAGWGYGNDAAVDSISLSCSANCGTTPAPSNVPEPSSLMLLGVALAGLVHARRRRA